MPLIARPRPGRKQLIVAIDTPDPAKAASLSRAAAWVFTTPATAASA